MEEFAFKPKKSVTFGKVRVRILLNYYDEEDEGRGRLAEKRSGGEKGKKNGHGDRKEWNDSRGRREESLMGGKRKPTKDMDPKGDKCQRVKDVSVYREREKKSLATEQERSKVSRKEGEKAPVEGTRSSQNETKTKSILKKTRNISHATDKALVKSESKVGNKSHRKSMINVEGPSTRARKLRSGKFGTVTLAIKSKVKSKKVDANTKGNSNLDREKKRCKTDKDKSVKVFHSLRHNVLNILEKKTSRNNISTISPKEKVDSKNGDKNFKPDAPEKSKNTQSKDNKKRPGVEMRDIVKGMQHHTGASTGTEADWTDTTKSLSKIGVEVGEDKRQNYIEEATNLIFRTLATLPGYQLCSPVPANFS